MCDVVQMMCASGGWSVRLQTSSFEMWSLQVICNIRRRHHCSNALMVLDSFRVGEIHGFLEGLAIPRLVAAISIKFSLKSCQSDLSSWERAEKQASNSHTAPRVLQRNN